MCSSFSGMVVGGGIGPFPEEGLDKAFGFAVGAGTIGPGETLANAEFGADLTESMRAITTAVVAEHALDADPESGVILDRGPQEGDRGGVFLVGKDAGKSQPGMVVYGHVHKLPADAGSAPSPVAMDPMTNPTDTTQFLDVDVEQPTR